MPIHRIFGTAFRVKPISITTVLHGTYSKTSLVGPGLVSFLGVLVKGIQGTFSSISNTCRDCMRRGYRSHAGSGPGLSLPEILSLACRPCFRIGSGPVHLLDLIGWSSLRSRCSWPRVKVSNGCLGQCRSLRFDTGLASSMWAKCMLVETTVVSRCGILMPVFGF